MDAEVIKVGKLSCYCAITPGSHEIAYLLSPIDGVEVWVNDTAELYGISIVVVLHIDWDNDLTPWPAPGQPPGCPPFKGLAPQFFRTLTNTVLPTIESKYSIQKDIVRTLVGVSLSGLFTLWQWPQSIIFQNIVTLSGSYWYEGFEQWIFTQNFSSKTGKCYMLLGEAEPHSSVAAFRCVGKATESIVGYLRRQGVNITFNYVPGNHFQFPIHRLTLAFHHIYRHIQPS